MERSRVSLILLIGICSVVTVLTIASLGIEEWSKYCFWEYGLHSASAIGVGEGFSDPDSIQELYNDVCDEDFLRGIIQSDCANFCDNLKKIRIGGVFMIFLGSASIIAQLVAASLGILKIVKEDFNLRIAKIFLIGSSITYIVGYIIYLITVNPTNIDDSMKGKNFVGETGIYFAAVMCVVMIADLIIGFFLINKFQQPTEALITESS